jgi:hypothetical protein
MITYPSSANFLTNALSASLRFDLFNSTSRNGDSVQGKLAWCCDIAQKLFNKVSEKITVNNTAIS